MKHKKPIQYLIEDTWMDHPQVLDRSLTDPDYRISTRKMKHKHLKRPVIITAHGYTASTYEWEEFREYVEAKSNFLVSNILLGAHGKSIYEFENSTWQQWGQPVIEEYQALVNLGYKNISLIGSSTGGTLVLLGLLSGEFEMNLQQPRNVILVDPFIVAADKFFSLVPVARFFIRNLPYRKFSEEERKHWFVNRPASTLYQLYLCVKKLVRAIKRKPVLPAGTQLTIYKAKKDEAAHPAGAALAGKCILQHDGTKPEIIMADTDKHVFTRGKGRARWTEADRQLQLQTFDHIIEKIL